MEEQDDHDVLGEAEAEAFIEDLFIDDDDDICDDNPSSSFMSSELNTRKRLIRQLLTLRGIVPSITNKMDKRSILVDAMTYLQDMVDQTEIELEKQNQNISTTYTADAATKDLVHAIVGSPDDSSPADVESLPQPSVAPCSAIYPAITKMEAEEIDKENYILKIISNKAPGAIAQVQRSLEMLKGIEIMSVSISKYDQHHMQSTAFLLYVDDSARAKINFFFIRKIDLGFRLVAHKEF